MRRLLPLVALLALLTAACRIETNIGADIKANGSGVITAEIGYDEEAAGLIEQFGEGEDLFTENPLADLPNVQVSEEDRDGMHYRVYTAEVEDVEAFITERMAGESGGLIEQFSLTIEPDRVEVTGRGSAGAAMEGAGDFEGMTNPALLAESLSINLRLTLPGKILEHNADSQDGSTLTWSIPFTGEALDIRAVSDPSQSEGGGFPLWAIIVIAAVVVAGIAAIALVGRRRSRTAVAPPPPPPDLPPA
jgi:predicted small secreted protein